MSFSSSVQPADKLIVALDFASAGEALRFVERLDGQCRWLKVGLELYLAEGPAIVRTLREKGFNIFLDLKLHDIPNTVAAAVRSVAHLDISLLTVHAAGGPVMLQAAQDAAHEFKRLRLLAVTVLTSMETAQLNACGVALSPADQVSRLGLLARECKLPGLVCSAEEVVRLRRELGEETTLVVPGIRLAHQTVGSGQDDQRRVATPYDAIIRGASMLVVGRPITRAESPAAAAAAVLAEVQRAMSSGSEHND